MAKNITILNLSVSVHNKVASKKYMWHILRVNTLVVIACAKRRSFKCTMTFAIGHTTLRIPDPIRTPQSSSVRLG